MSETALSFINDWLLVHVISAQRLSIQTIRKLRKTSDRIARKFQVCLLDLIWTHLQDRSETCRPLSATYRLGWPPPMEGRGWH